MPEAQQEGNNQQGTVDDFDDDDETQGGQGDDGKGGDQGNKIEVKDGKVLVNGEEFDAERALGTIENQRKAEKDLKKQLGEVQAELKKIQNKDKPVDQQLSAERDELRVENKQLQQKLTRQALKSAALTEATSLKFKNPAIAYKLIDPDDVEWDDDEPVNLTSLLKREAKENPYLLRRGRTVDDDDNDDGADGGAGRGGGREGASDMNSLLRSAIAGRS